MSGLQDRVIVITGAGGGLGRAYALFAAAEGAKVVVNDLGGSRDGSGAGTSMADAVVEEIQAAGGDAVANYANIATEAGARSLIDAALATYGAIHGVVNNAGILRDTSFAKMTAAEFEAVLNVHLIGSFHVTNAAWPHLRAQGHGRIVMATSTSGLYGNFGQANYGAAKAGLVGLAATLAIEGRKNNVLVNSVAPMAATRMTEDVAPAEVLAKLGPEHVAPIVGYLLSDECTDSGTTYVVGGGSVKKHVLFESKGVQFSEPPSLAEVASRWSEVTDVSGAVPGSNPVG
ncbi:MAG TPA: SDR family NAD(P)-dependent oxidoreductase [Nocardioidaceae bacterium]|nr:SDR family NAD(P)-dependent oxidoreductase [Nocardioidaceae bacterium]